MKVIRTTDKDGKPLQLKLEEDERSTHTEEEIREMMIRSFLESEGVKEAQTKSPQSYYPDPLKWEGTLESYKKEVQRRKDKAHGKVSLAKKNTNLKYTDPGYWSKHTGHNQPH